MNGLKASVNRGLFFLLEVCDIEEMGLFTKVHFFFIAAFIVLRFAVPSEAALAPGASLSASPSPSPVKIEKNVVTKAVGEAGAQIVTSREVRINDMIEQALYTKDPGQKGIQPLTGSESTFQGEVATVLMEWAVYLEAKSFSSKTIPENELEKAIKTVRSATQAVPAWHDLDPSHAEVREIVERKLTAKNFMHLKTESSLVPITDSEALNYFQKNRLKFGNLPFSAFRENIKSFLIKQQTDRRLKDWVDVLNRKYKVRNFIAG